MGYTFKHSKYYYSITNYNDFKYTILSFVKYIKNYNTMYFQEWLENCIYLNKEILNK